MSFIVSAKPKIRRGRFSKPTIPRMRGESSICLNASLKWLISNPVDCTQFPQTFTLNL
jgi:hypothetical protein